MLFDSHAHLNFKAYDEDRADVLSRVKEAGMLVTNVGAGHDSSAQAVAIADSHDFCYASVGLHPIHIYDEAFEPAAYELLIKKGNGKVRAVGECGLDYWHIKRPDIPFDEVKDKQIRVFEQQIDLALKHDLALMIHGRNGVDNLTAYKTIYEIVVKKGVKRATVHCYGGDLEEALMFVDLGFYIGITGILTFDTTGKLQEIVQAVPLDHLLIETDAPYLTPIPYRGKRNEPPYVIEVAKRIAEIKKSSLQEVVERTGENAKRLYEID